MDIHACVHLSLLILHCLFSIKERVISNKASYIAVSTLHLIKCVLGEFTPDLAHNQNRLPYMANAHRKHNIHIHVLLLSWAARHNTWLLIKLTPKGVIFSFLLIMVQIETDAKHCLWPNMLGSIADFKWRQHCLHCRWGRCLGDNICQSTKNT